MIVTRNVSELWEQDPKPTCQVKCTWVYYHSFKIRECCDCNRREPLWADFGLTKKVDLDE